MDDPNLERGAHCHALEGLARIHKWSRTSERCWALVESEAKRRGITAVRILDLACGGGDIALGMARLSRSSPLQITIQGCDRSSTALEFAHERAEDVGLKVSFFQHDVLSGPLPEGYDFFTCSFFLHHLSENQIVALVEEMHRSAGMGVVVHDLERSLLGYALARVATRLLTDSPVVRFDGPASVAAALTREELRRLAERAGLPSFRLRRCWPFRLFLSWSTG